MKANQQNFQLSKDKPLPVQQQPMKVEEKEDLDDEYSDEDDIPPIAPNPVAMSRQAQPVERAVASPVERAVEKPVRDKEQIIPENQIAMEIEMLQNDGRFRVELLHQLQEINRALVVIAGTMVDLSKNDKV